MVAFGFLLPNFVRWWEPTNDTLSFCKCRLSRGHSNPTCCMQIGLNLLHSEVPCAPRATIFITDRKGKVMFSQVFVCPQSASWLLTPPSLLGFVTARSVCILLECFLVFHATVTVFLGYIATTYVFMVQLQDFGSSFVSHLLYNVIMLQCCQALYFSTANYLVHGSDIG